MQAGLTTPPKPTRKQRAEMRESHAAKEDKKTPGQLTEDEVRAIRSGRAQGVGALGLALKYNIRIGAVYEIHKRRARADVPALFETPAQREDRERRHKENVEREKKREEAIRAAVDDVLRGREANTIDAALNRGLPLAAVRRALREAKQAKKAAQ